MSGSHERKENNSVDFMIYIRKGSYLKATNVIQDGYDVSIGYQLYVSFIKRIAHVAYRRIDNLYLFVKKRLKESFSSRYQNSIPMATKHVLKATLKPLMDNELFIQKPDCLFFI